MTLTVREDILNIIHCIIAASIASRFHITKYPTLKLLRNGQASKREYRGQRSAEAFASFIKEELQDPIKIIKSLNETQNLEVSWILWFNPLTVACSFFIYLFFVPLLQHFTINVEKKRQNTAHSQLTARDLPLCLLHISSQRVNPMIADVLYTALYCT